MVRVFLSHASKDKNFVHELREFLREGGEIETWLDEYDIPYGGNVVSSIADGLQSADAVLLILSPEAVESRWVTEEWSAKYWEQVNSGRVQLLPVLFHDCNIPPLLRNKKYFDLRTNHPDGFRKIKACLLGLKPSPPPSSNLPQRRMFVGRSDELLELRKRLAQPGVTVAVPGMPGLGKTSLALAFAHEYRADFETVYWLDCSGQSLAGLAADMERQIGLKFEGDLETSLAEMRRYCAARRCLVVLDNVEDETLKAFVPNGQASVLVTTRREYLAFVGLRPPLELRAFTRCRVSGPVCEGARGCGEADARGLAGFGSQAGKSADCDCRRGRSDQVRPSLHDRDLRE